MASPIGQLVAHLHQKAAAEGRLPIVELDPAEPRQFSSDDAASCVAVIAGHWLEPRKAHSRGAVIGVELRTGNLLSEDARRVRRVALSKLRDYGTFLEVIDQLGYTPSVVRAALTYHYATITQEPLGSDGNAVLMDLQVAMRRSSERTKQVVELLVSGVKPQAMGELFASTDGAIVNGSRLTGRALAELCAYLEGKR